MKFYTNTVPFALEWDNQGKPKLLGIGTTFAVIGADPNGMMLKDVGTIGDDNMACSVSPIVFTTCFKEVKTVETITE